MTVPPVDINTDFQDDSGGRDPDIYSPLLQTYHQLLWSKELPDGRRFDLEPGRIGAARVLRHRSDAGEFVLSSDTLANSNRNARPKFYAAMGTGVNSAWHRYGGTIGGRLVFPRNRINGKQTINQRRGTHPQIRDRFDLTLEAIRRFYVGLDSPLGETLEAYSSFFSLFRDFRGYVDFFLLQDLVDGGGDVRFYLPFSVFGKNVLPDSLEQYREFRTRQLEFVAARNVRIVGSLGQ